jgi:hypothetical protein
MDLREIIAQIEAAGGVLNLKGESITYEVPAQVRPLLVQLREQKTDAVQILRERQAVSRAIDCPALPHGIRIIRFEPKQPPVLIESYAVVTDVRKFIETELRELDGRLHAPVQIRGGFGIFTILDWLAQCGLEVEIARRNGAFQKPCGE